MSLLDGGVWRAAGRLSTPRCGHGLAADPRSSVLSAVGGYAGAAQSRAQRHTTTPRHRVERGANTQQPRCGHVLAANPRSSVLCAVGGYADVAQSRAQRLNTTEYVSTTELFDT